MMKKKIEKQMRYHRLHQFGSEQTAHINNNNLLNLIEFSKSLPTLSCIRVTGKWNQFKWWNRKAKEKGTKKKIRKPRRTYAVRNRTIFSIVWICSQRRQRCDTNKLYALIPEIHEPFHSTTATTEDRDGQQPKDYSFCTWTSKRWRQHSIDI